jgi:wyosine [tRNA(Phe)-imidazoG37] synthetase (radical SAM superfamily)
MSIYTLIKGIVYGPVKSRRLGNSLGINLLPSEQKTCTFNCTYCQWGFTKYIPDKNNLEKIPFPHSVDVELDLVQRLKILQVAGIEVNYITFSGNGEPTLYPNFYEIVKAVTKIRDRYYPDARVAILTNGSLLSNKMVVEGLNLLDERIVKLDAGDEDLFQRLCSPLWKTSIEDVVSGMQRLTDKVIQSMFVCGSVDNATDEFINGWIKKVAMVKPKYVQIYSIDRTPADMGIEKVPDERLHQIAHLLQKETSIKAFVY